MKRRLWGRIFGLLLVGAALFFAIPMPAALQQRRLVSNLRLLDRRGQELRRVASSESEVQHRVKLSAISPWLVQATLASEDRFFYWHPGLDPGAVLRASRENLRAGRVVQGGSTLSQQVVRGLLGDRERSWSQKLVEAFWALRLERSCSKEEILECYLNLAPYGFQTRGCEAAAELYFDKPASQLSLAESCFLAVLPRAPESFLPYQRPEEIEVFQKKLLLRLRHLNWISEQDYQRALQEPIRLRPLHSHWEAGHFCDYVLSQLPGGTQGEIRTTLDRQMQQEVEGILAVHLKRLQRQAVGHAAVVVLDVSSGEVLAMVGSGDYGTHQFNACLSGRQPGSTLKPFTYALALERGILASSLLPDLPLYPVHIEGGYIPRNYDERYRGPVRLREALACSYNVPVVRLLEQLGVDVLLQRLRRLGFDRLQEGAQHYGLGLTLGGGEVSLLQLARAYRCLARGGLYSREKLWMDQPDPPQEAVFDGSTTDLITHILQDPQARVPAFGRSGPLNLPFPCAVKTGTSKGYRDNWTVGYTPLYVVACWVGNFDGSAMRGEVSGVTGAAPIFRDVMQALVERDQGSPAFAYESSLLSQPVCEVSGQTPGPDCSRTLQEWFIPPHLPEQTCEFHQRRVIDRRSGDLAGPDCPREARQEKLFTVYPPLYRGWALAQGIAQPPPSPTGPGREQEVAIVFPDHGAVFRRDESLRSEFQKLHLQVVVPPWCEAVDWSIGPETVTSARPPFDCWWALQPGNYRILATARGKNRKAVSRAIAISVQ